MAYPLDGNGSKVAFYGDQCLHFIAVLEPSGIVDDEDFDGVTNLWICEKNRYISIHTVLRRLHSTVIY